jgi:ribosomal-protein-alanine N-acetyltransferase
METRDIQSVIALDRQSFSLPWPESAFHYEVEKNAASHCWVAEIIDDENNPVLAGMIVVWLILDEVHIATIAVNPVFRKHHIGQRLLAYTLINAVDLGANKAFLEVRKCNLAARELYRKFGFIEVGMRRWYYQDNREDAILLNLENLDKDSLIPLQ